MACSELDSTLLCRAYWRFLLLARCMFYCYYILRTAILYSLTTSARDEFIDLFLLLSSSLSSVLWEYLCGCCPPLYFMLLLLIGNEWFFVL